MGTSGLKLVLIPNGMFRHWLGLFFGKTMGGKGSSGRLDTQLLWFLSSPETRSDLLHLIKTDFIKVDLLV